METGGIYATRRTKLPPHPHPSPARGEGGKAPAGPVLISYPGAERWRSRYAGDTRIRAIAGGHATMPRVLFVEDDPDIGQLISSWLGRHDIEVLLETRGDLALARVELRDARLIVLDEATAEANSSGSRELERAAAELLRGRTALVVAHRLNTIQNADQILVIDQGRLAACGRQEELLNTCPLYRTMWEQYQSTAAFAGKEAN